ncbi:MAG: hypothetical protein D3910_06140 [Candidatus Electrothrix sp. ATG2]|nr:hypothetical protein [Candidatus Electrothrix sp. ATG2]
MDKLQGIIEEIKKLEKELLLEVQKKEGELFYKIKGKKIYFEEETKKYHKTLTTKIFTYISNASLLNIVTAPFIWFCIVPAVFMDIVVSTYQFICFKIYGIPKVNRSDYIVIDRQSLNYLNIMEKINCAYCGYFNGLIAYIQEIAARTEQYWCPIKHARKISTIHKRYYKFFDFGDHQGYQKGLAAMRKDFDELED